MGTTSPSAEGRDNVSSRSSDSLSVLGPHRVGWVDYTGSGAETIAHLRENGRICTMFASFDRRPRIVRLHGRGAVALPGDPTYDGMAGRRHPSTRAVIVINVDRVSDSCWHGVPVMDLVEHRDLLRPTAEKKGPERLAAERAAQNTRSIDGLPGLPSEQERPA